MNSKAILYVILIMVSFYFIQTFFIPKRKEEEVVYEKKVKEKEVKPQEDEKFYVLENEHQQLVFSNIGGSLVEINLPQKADYINPIEIDKKILKDHKENDYFPQKPYFTKNLTKKQNILGGYYPLLRRSTYLKNGKLGHYIPPKYYALNLVSSDSSISNIKYKLKKIEDNLIEFEGSDNLRTITKTYSFNKDAPYTFTLSLNIKGQSSNVYLTSGIPEVELSSNRAMNSLKIKSNKDILSLSLPKNSKKVKGQYVDWASNSNGFFGIIIDPLDEVKLGYKTSYIQGKKAPSRITLIDAKYNLYPPSKYPGYQMTLPVPSNEKVTFRIFAGPFQTNVLNTLDNIYSKPSKGYYSDYIKVKKIKGWFSFASEPFAKLLFFIMSLFYKITHSWGFSIILLTIVFRIMLFPLNSWSIKSTLKMQEITPILKVIDAKYKKDPKKANLEKMRIFKEKGANPLSGCLPLIIQLPFLMGMFNLLRNTFELRGVSFIPGWIDNLTSPDVLFSWKYPIFFIRNQFHLLPILLGAVMFIQSKMNAKMPKDKSKLTDQQKQQMMMTYAMPVLFMILFYNAASGLNIYFLFSMILGILQQWYMSKKRNASLG